MTQLPGIAGDIEAVIGLDLTAKLLRVRGGTEILVPVRAKNSQLAQIIGIPATEKMAKGYGTGKVTLPTAGFRGLDAIQRQHKEEAIKHLQNGMAAGKVALLCNLHERTVWRYKAHIDDRQDEFKF